MKLTAYTFAGPWQVWEDVDLWLLDGPKLMLVRGRTKGSASRELVMLPREVIGVADNGPNAHRSEGRGTTYTPTPEKALRQVPRAERHLHERIVDRAGRDPFVSAPPTRRERRGHR